MLHRGAWLTAVWIASFCGGGVHASPPTELLRGLMMIPAADGTARISDVQKDLAWLGLYSGPTDGRDDRVTRNSIMAFQRSIGSAMDGSLGPDEARILEDRASQTEQEYRFARFKVDWLGISLDVPGALWRPATLFDTENPDQVVFYALSHPSNFGLSLIDYGPELSASPTVFATDFALILQRENPTTKIVLSRAYAGSFFISYVVDGTRFTLVAEENGGRWRAAEFFVDEDYYWIMRPVMARVIASLKLFDGPGLSRTERADLIRRGDQPQSDLLPDWFDTMVGNGSGSLVSLQGHVLTNLHVIASCARLTVNGNPAQLIGSDARLDLAILQSDAVSGRNPIRFRDSNPALGEQIAVMGYPVFGISRTVNYTTGIVSSATGLLGDRTRVQVTAPIQPGNSGGPVLDTEGRQVAVVVSKASTELQSASNIENIGWVIRGGEAVRFLRRFDIDPFMSSDIASTSLPSVERVSEWRQRVLRIECHSR